MTIQRFEDFGALTVDPEVFLSGRDLYPMATQDSGLVVDILAAFARNQGEDLFVQDILETSYIPCYAFSALIGGKFPVERDILRAGFSNAFEMRPNRVGTMQTIVGEIKGALHRPLTLAELANIYLLVPNKEGTPTSPSLLQQKFLTEVDNLLMFVKEVVDTNANFGLQNLVFQHKLSSMEWYKVASKSTLIPLLESSHIRIKILHALYTLLTGVV